MTKTSDVNARLIFTVGIVSAVLLIVIVIGIQAWFLYEVKLEAANKVMEYPYQPLVDLRAVQKDKISRARVVGEDGKYEYSTISIGDAMKEMADPANKGMMPSTAPAVEH